MERGLVIAHSNVVADFVTPAPRGLVKFAGTTHGSFAKKNNKYILE